MQSRGHLEKWLLAFGVRDYLAIRLISPQRRGILKKMTSIRLATQADFKFWSQMRAALWPSSTAEEHLTDLKHMFNLEAFKGWIALDDKKVIGFAEAYLRPFANGCESRPVVFLEGIWVEETYRRQGIARQMIKAIETWAKSLGIDEIGSDTELSNSFSQRCHSKWGFEETERVVYFRKKL